VEVILLERVSHLGIMGQVVSVKTGYARNYLLPLKKALRATPENVEFFQSQKAVLEADNIKKKDEAAEAGQRMADLVVVLVRQASESGHLYGSVSARDVSEAVTEKGFKVGRQQINLGKPVKELGMHPAHVILHPEVSVPILLNIAQSEEEAEKQLQNMKRAQKGKEEAPSEKPAEKEEKIQKSDVDSEETL
jgi:large subunit ribosomal protein L9